MPSARPGARRAVIAQGAVMSPARPLRRAPPLALALALALFEVVAAAVEVVPAPAPAPAGACVTTEAELRAAAELGGSHCVEGLVAVSGEQTAVERDLELYSASGVAGRDGFTFVGASAKRLLLVAGGADPVSLRLEGLSISGFAGAVSAGTVSASGDSADAFAPGADVSVGALAPVYVELLNCTISENEGGFASPPTNSAVFASGQNGEASVFISGCTFTNSTGQQGAAIIAVWFADVTVEDSLFEALTTQLDGGAVYMILGANLSVARSTFRNCTGENAAVAILGGASGDDFIDVEMVDTLFESNGGPPEAIPFGGAINTVASEGNLNTNTTVNLTLIRCTFNNNRAASGGAIAHGFATMLNVTDCAFNSNVAQSPPAQGNGGAIYSRGPLVVTGSSFFNNTALQQPETEFGGSGGALMLAFGIPGGFGVGQQVRSCSFTNNTSPSASGSAIAMGGGNLTVNISDSSFTGNAAGGPFGAVALVVGPFDAVDNQPEDQQGTSSIQVLGSSFDGNTAATQVATAVYAAGDNVSACGSGNDYANDPVPQTTIPDPLPICT